jgi:hypothetical protein
LIEQEAEVTIRWLWTHANELRALQAPLKKQYREQPETARTLARGEGRP